VDAWSPGERAVQRRLGGTEVADRMLPGIGNEVPAAGRNFLRRQPWLGVGARLADGTVWASGVAGPPGFLDAPEPDLLTVAALPAAGDPLAGVIAAGGPVGTLALEPARRRRLRANGRAFATAEGWAVALDQVVANCPRYIQRRTLDEAWVPSPAEVTGPSVAVLDDRRRAWIAGADTFFLATADAGGDADLSHRGGVPGFVDLRGDGTLAWDELPGNSMYLTLGNLEGASGAGLLFVDFATGDTLHVAGDAAVTYAPGGAPRVSVTPRRVLEVRHGAPAPWSDPEPSPFLGGAPT
jgi:predicted pyridoxine 5'-phosphate oxidase superfamily flavin-nucleotide-binding protein